MPNLLDSEMNDSVDKSDREDLIFRVEEIKDNPDLNDWEIEFIDSILERLEKGYDLTEKQLEKFQDIEIELPFRGERMVQDYGNECIF